MVRLRVPVLSLSASGDLAGLLTYQTIRGIQIAKLHADPRNPSTNPQVAHREAFRYLVQRWPTLPTADQASWADAVHQLHISPRNAYASNGLLRSRRLHTPSDSFPVLALGTLPTWTPFTTAILGNTIRHRMSITALNDVQGWSTHWSTTSGFTRTPANLLKMLPITATGLQTWDQPNMPAGTYYFRYRVFTTDGLASSWSVQRTAVIP